MSAGPVSGSASGQSASPVAGTAGFFNFGPFAQGERIEALHYFYLSDITGTYEIGIAFASARISTDAAMAASENLIADAINIPPTARMPAVLGFNHARIPIGRYVGSHNRFLAVKLLNVSVGLDLFGSLWIEVAPRTVAAVGVPEKGPL